MCVKFKYINSFDKRKLNEDDTNSFSFWHLL